MSQLRLIFSAWMTDTPWLRICWPFCQDRPPPIWQPPGFWPLGCLLGGGHGMRDGAWQPWLHPSLPSPQDFAEMPFRICSLHHRFSSALLELSGTAILHRWMSRQKGRRLIFFSCFTPEKWEIIQKPTEILVMSCVGTARWDFGVHKSGVWTARWEFGVDKIHPFLKPWSILLCECHKGLT